MNIIYILPSTHSFQPYIPSSLDKLPFKSSGNASYTFTVPLLSAFPPSNSPCHSAHLSPPLSPTNTYASCYLHLPSTISLLSLSSKASHPSLLKLFPSNLPRPFSPFLSVMTLASSLTFHPPHHPYPNRHLYSKGLRRSQRGKISVLACLLCYPIGQSMAALYMLLRLPRYLRAPESQSVRSVQRENSVATYMLRHSFLFPPPPPVPPSRRLLFSLKHHFFYLLQCPVLLAAPDTLFLSSGAAINESSGTRGDPPSVTE